MNKPKKCEECGGAWLQVGSGAVCENGCGKIQPFIEGAKQKLATFGNVARLMKRFNRDWKEYENGNGKPKRPKLVWRFLAGHWYQVPPVP